MAATPSLMVPLGTPAPVFSLPDVRTGKTVTLEDIRAGRTAVLIMFLCNHCPYVKHVRAQLALIGRDYADRGVGIAGISSNDAAQYPADGPVEMKLEAEVAGYTFAYLYDESQAVAASYKAVCTPDFFVYDARTPQTRLVYRGQLDDSRPKVASPLPVTGADLRAALDAVLAGLRPIDRQLPSIGCNIKWKPGRVPPEPLG